VAKYPSENFQRALKDSRANDPLPSEHSRVPESMALMILFQLRQMDWDCDGFAIADAIRGSSLAASRQARYSDRWRDRVALDAFAQPNFRASLDSEVIAGVRNILLPRGRRLGQFRESASTTRSTDYHRTVADGGYSKTVA
jgi:hypothetical protein